MARGTINTRVELDQQDDATLRRIMEAEGSTSKRNTMAKILRRVCRHWNKDRTILVTSGLVRIEDDDGQFLRR